MTSPPVPHPARSPGAFAIRHVAACHFLNTSDSSDFTGPRPRITLAKPTHRRDHSVMDSRRATHVPAFLPGFPARFPLVRLCLCASLKTMQRQTFVRHQNPSTRILASRDTKRGQMTLSFDFVFAQATLSYLYCSAAAASRHE